MEPFGVDARNKAGAMRRRLPVAPRQLRLPSRHISGLPNKVLWRKRVSPADLFSQECPACPGPGSGQTAETPMPARMFPPAKVVRRGSYGLRNRTPAKGKDPPSRLASGEPLQEAERRSYKPRCADRVSRSDGDPSRRLG